MSEEGFVDWRTLGAEAVVVGEVRCDRCHVKSGLEDSLIPNSWAIGWIGNNLGNDQQVTMCEKCHKKFNDWIDELVDEGELRE